MIWRQAAGEVLKGFLTVLAVIVALVLAVDALAGRQGRSWWQ